MARVLRKYYSLKLIEIVKAKSLVSSSPSRHRTLSLRILIGLGTSILLLHSISQCSLKSTARKTLHKRPKTMTFRKLRKRISHGIDVSSAAMGAPAQPNNLRNRLRILSRPSLTWLLVSKNAKIESRHWRRIGNWI